MKKRWRDHRSDAFNNAIHQYNCPLYCAFRKYGIKNFSFEVIEECLPFELDEREILNIAKYHAFGPDGYNQTPGGTGAKRVDLDPIILGAIFNRLKTTEDSYAQIAQDFEIQTATVHSINNGKCCYHPSETYPIRAPLGNLSRYHNQCAICGKVIEIRYTHCVKCSNKINNFKLRRADRPDPLELAQMIVKSSFVKVGEVFGVSDNAIKKWCKSYDMPSTRRELIDWYNKHQGADGRIVSAFAGSKMVNQIDPTTGMIVNVFGSLGDAAKSIGGDRSHIGAVCRGQAKTAYGYIWAYA